jgi:hypothetical protein
MKDSTRGLVRWGALALEAYSLFVLYNGTFMVPGPYNERLGLIAGVAVISLAFAWLCSSYWENSTAGSRRMTMRIVSKPPFILWFLAAVPPAITVGFEIFTYYQTGRWGH